MHVKLQQKSGLVYNVQYISYVFLFTVLIISIHKMHQMYILGCLWLLTILLQGSKFDCTMFENSCYFYFANYDTSSPPME